MHTLPRYGFVERLERTAALNSWATCADCRNVHTVLCFAFFSLTAQAASATVPGALFALAPPTLPAAAAPAPDAAQSFQFAGTRWGASAAETRSALAAHGFQFEIAHGDGA